MKTIQIVFPSVTATAQIPDDPTAAPTTQASGTAPLPLRPAAPDVPRQEGWTKIFGILAVLAVLVLGITAALVVLSIHSKAPPMHQFAQQPAAAAVQPASQPPTAIQPLTPRAVVDHDALAERVVELIEEGEFTFRRRDR